MKSNLESEILKQLIEQEKREKLDEVASKFKDKCITVFYV